MAVIVGFVIGAVAANRRLHYSFGIVLVPPLALAVLEIVVNTVRFGAGAMVVWAPLLLVLTVGATALGSFVGRRLGARRDNAGS
jgi:CDP-diglyceride synthetase